MALQISLRTWQSDMWVTMNESKSFPMATSSADENRFPSSARLRWDPTGVHAKQGLVDAHTQDS